MVPAADSNYATSDPRRSLGEENTNRSATSPFGLLETDDNGNRVDNPRQQIQIDNLVPTFTARSFANASQQVSPEVGVERPSLNPTPPTITGPTPATAPTTPTTTTRTLLQAHMLARSTNHWYFPFASRPADFDPSWHPPLPPTRVNESELEEEVLNQDPILMEPMRRPNTNEEEFQQTGLLPEEERLRRRQETYRNYQRRRRERLREQAREEQTEQGEQIEDQNNALLRNDLSVTEMLATIGSGQAKSSDFPPLHKHPNMVECHNDFHRILKEARMENWFHCKWCRERGPNTKKAMPSPRQRVRPQDDECEQCFKSRKEHGIRKFPAENNMDPIVDLLQQSRIFLRQWFKVLMYPIESAGRYSIK